MNKQKLTLFLLLVLCGTLWAIPEMVFRTPDNKNIYLRDYAGEPRLLRPDAPRYGVVLVFFRTDDSNLEDWFTRVNQLLKEYKTPKRRFFFIAVDDDPDAVKAFKQSKKTSAPVYMDVFRGAENLLDLPPGLYDGPGILLYRPDGTLIRKITPFRTHQLDELRSALNELP